MKEYPTELYPTILEGFIEGETIRFESLEGPEIFLDLNGLYKQQLIKQALIWNGGFQLQNLKPFVYSENGKTYAVTHLQKQSQRGYLKVSPDCYHRWWWLRKQQKDAQGNWLPGTERGLYFRKPFSWRWQNDKSKPWEWTKGFLGLRWD